MRIVEEQLLDMAIGPVNVSVDAVLRKRVCDWLVLLALRRDEHLHLTALGRDDGQRLEIGTVAPRAVQSHVFLALGHGLAPLHPAFNSLVQAALSVLVALRGDVPASRFTIGVDKRTPRSGPNRLPTPNLLVLERAEPVSQLVVQP